MICDPNTFVSFGKIPRLFRPIVITEKLDGTNACVRFPEDGGPMLIGSRSRWITPEDDNYGFARWAVEREPELRVGLGFGTHYGEWWGAGIQRKYGLTEKRFSLFNTSRWNAETKPACCSVVPVIYSGPFTANAVESALNQLLQDGSCAAPGFMKPEGVVIYHVAANCYFKATVEKDDEPKGR